MFFPTIEINGVTYKMIKPKAKNWAKFAKFDAERKNLNLEEYVDSLCDFMADIFEGVTKEDLLDNLYLEEVQKKYYECANCYWNLLSGKFEELEKNFPTAEVAAAMT